MIRTLLAASSASLALATAATAGPLDVPPPPPPVVVDQERCPDAFDCAYIGLEFRTVRPSLDATGPTIALSDFEDGRALGIFAGYNFQNGNFVYGGEARYLAFSDTEFAGGVGSELNSAIDLRGRAGFAVGSVMFYGALGYSWVDVDFLGSSGTLDGMNYGLGAELNVTERFFLGVDMTRRDVSGDVGLFDLDGDVDTATLRVGFRF